MDSQGGALLPLATGFRLKGIQARWGCSIISQGSLVNVPEEVLDWSFTPRSGVLSGLPDDEKQPEIG